jgi:hypothetical protein
MSPGESARLGCPAFLWHGRLRISGLRLATEGFIPAGHPSTAFRPSTHARLESPAPPVARDRVRKRAPRRARVDDPAGDGPWLVCRFSFANSSSHPIAAARTRPMCSRSLGSRGRRSVAAATVPGSPGGAACARRAPTRGSRDRTAPRPTANASHPGHPTPPAPTGVGTRGAIVYGVTPGRVGSWPHLNPAAGRAPAATRRWPAPGCWSRPAAESGFGPVGPIRARSPRPGFDSVHPSHSPRRS